MVIGGRGFVLAALLIALAGSGEAQDMLRPGTPVTVDPGASGLIRLGLPAPAGSFIAGRIDAGDTPVTADLIHGDGSHMRRLSDARRGSVEFQAMTGEGTLLQLSAPGPVGVTLERLVPPTEQRPAVQEFLSPRMGALAEHLAEGGDSAAFWEEIASEGTPLVEDGGQGEVMLTFLWRGASHNVRLFGGPSSDHEWLERLGDSDVWFKSFRVPDDTRLSYRLAPDVPDVPGSVRLRRTALLATAQADPLNRAPWPADAIDGFNTYSTVTLPSAPDQPGTPPSPNADPVVQTMTFISRTLGNSREVTIAHPRAMDARDPRLVVALIFDGEAALNQMEASAMLDTLTRDGRLPPVVSVLIPSIDSPTRSRELPGNDAFADALADDLLPLVATRLGIATDPARTVLAGASYGGLAAVTAALHRPETFGNALSMSGSFWWAPHGEETDGTPWAAQQFVRSDRLPLRFFLSAGTFETARPGSAGIFETSRELRDILRMKGYSVDWRAYAGGHDYLVWRGALADGMIALFGR